MSKPLPATLVTRLELAEHFQVSRRTVSVWDKLRLIPRIKVGSVIRYDPKAVMAAISSRQSPLAGLVLIDANDKAVMAAIGSQSLLYETLDLALRDFQDVQLAARKGTDEASL